MAKITKKKKAPGRVQSQAERRAMGNRLVVAITLSPEELEALDQLSRGESRGRFIGGLLRQMMEARHGR